MAKLISKLKVAALLEKLSGWEVYAPVSDEGIYRFVRLDGKAPELEYSNSRKPPKEVFFPQTEKMLDIEKKGKDYEVTDPKPSDAPMLVLGVRPCDARSFISLDALFNWDYVDPYFVEKRDRATVVAFSCVGTSMPAANCFCTSVGGSPSGTDGADMLWTDLGDSYYVEPVSEKGQRLLMKAHDLFADADAGADGKAAEAKKKGEDAIIRTLDTDGVKQALEKNFTSDYWDSFSKRCLGCGICTLLCPTCHCFDINDVTKGGKLTRERTWDSCQFEHYSVHASGHNPRPAKKHRQRNRVYHKYLTSQEKQNEIGCVGCGRCITRCPVNIDIIEVVEGVKNLGGGE